jgi:phosphoglycerate dehydrogenase-like enzyme
MPELDEILYLCQHGDPEPWRGDFLEAARGRLAVRAFDPDAPLDQQLASVKVVVDQGGHASRDIIDAGAAAGVALWQVVGTGLDHTEVDHILDHGIALANTPGQFSAVALAEHALFLILALAKRLPEADRNCRSGRMYAPVADELGGQLLGIVGLGASGRELARRAAALGMRIRAVDVATPADSELRDLGIEHFDGLEGLDDLLAAADYVSLHLPLTAATEHLIDARRLSLMRPSSRLVNVARGRIVDEQALADALRDGIIAGAGIDVFGQEPLQPDHPLLAVENIVVTPHIAGVTRGTSRRRSEAAVENALRVLAGKQARHLITRDPPAQPPS